LKSLEKLAHVIDCFYFYIYIDIKYILSAVNDGKDPDYFVLPLNTKQINIKYF